MNESKEKENHKHPSFGQISFSRISTSGNIKFYGSELPQDHYIQMEIHKSDVTRDLICDRYFNYEIPLVKIRMTAGQFSELITSLNMGAGTPCTIEMIDQKKVEEMPEQESRKEFIHRKFEYRMLEFAKSIKEKQALAKQIIAKKTLSKQDIHDLNFHIEWLTQEVASNIPFFARQFQENMDEVVFEAKLEVENAIQHKISVLGLTELQNQNKLLKE
ncbi:MAG: hypothetical protein UT21_C0006G0017 [Candidatus Woesebacteria bacterium GW2011_GWA1_39_11b]|nr:MAG: hypothetical protein UT21_C0006G0017 [Candidatus Woesebacteria bacterium GW2011_GWA1_39_11b]